MTATERPGETYAAGVIANLQAMLAKAEAANAALTASIDAGRHEFDADRDVPHRCRHRGCGLPASSLVHRTAARVLADLETT